MKGKFVSAILIVWLFSACSAEKKYADTMRMLPDEQVFVYSMTQKDEKQPIGFFQSLADAPAQTFPEVQSQFIPEYASVLIADTLKSDSTEVKPVIQPLVLGGTATMLVGTAAAAVGFLSTPVLIPVAAIFLLASCFLSGWGLRKIKEEPKKYKGEKLALLNYLIIGLVGVTASFYFLYLLFAV